MADQKSTTPPTDWFLVDEVRRQVEIAGQSLALATCRDYIGMTTFMLSDRSQAAIDSPLEAIFFAWWQAAIWNMDESRGGFTIDTQREVVANGNNYRLDFVVGLRDAEDAKRFRDGGRLFPLIAVEVDGHAFHERTKEQVAYRNRRDRDLQQEGWKVFHFSWSEVVENGAVAVASVLQCCSQEWSACDRVASDKWYAENPGELEKLNQAIAKVHADAKLYEAAHQ